MAKKEARNSFIDLYRFFAMFVVMGCHQYHLSVGGFPFGNGWIFAEFFFILTGYLTSSHFCLKSEKRVNCKEAFRYTVRKFMTMMPFVWSAILLEYIFSLLKMWLLSDASVSEMLIFMTKLPFELFMLTGLYTEPVLIPGWYLSAMLLVLPAFCILLQKSGERVLTILSALLPVAIYIIIGFEGNWTFPDNLLRASSGLLLGTFAFQLNQTVLPKLYRLLRQKWITLIQMIILFVPFVLCYRDPRNYYIVILCCFVLGIAVTMSGESFTGKLKSKAMVYLGKISLPLYLYHWTIAGVLASHRIPLSWNAKYILFHVLSVLFAICAYEFISASRFGKRRKIG